MTALAEPTLWADDLEPALLPAAGPKAVARRSDPETSHAAAASVEGISDTAARVLSVLEAAGRPVSDEELVELYLAAFGRTATPQSIRSRRAELVAAGVVEFSGEYGRTATGRRARLWAPTRAG